MAEEKYTRCPSCRTVFRVTPEQLALRDGQGALRPLPDGVRRRRGSWCRWRRGRTTTTSTGRRGARGPPTVTLRGAHAPSRRPLPTPTRPRRRRRRPAMSRVDGTVTAGPHAVAAARSRRRRRRPAGAEPRRRQPAPGAAPHGAHDRRLRAPATRPAAANGAARQRRRRAWLRSPGHSAWRAGDPARGRRSFHFRDARGPLAGGGATAHGSAARRSAARSARRARSPTSSIDASDLQADPAHQGLLILTATLRNRGRSPCAYPHLELTLTDAQDQVVVRRALAPGRIRRRHRRSGRAASRPTARSRSRCSSTPARPRRPATGSTCSTADGDPCRAPWRAVHRPTGGLPNANRHSITSALLSMTARPRLTGARAPEIRAPHRCAAASACDAPCTVAPFWCAGSVGHRNGAQLPDCAGTVRRASLRPDFGAFGYGIVLATDFPATFRNAP